MSTPNALIRALWWLALPVAGVLAWKAWNHNLAMLCSDRQWPWPTFCAEPGAEEPPVREQVARLQARIARNPGDGQAYAELARFAALPPEETGLDGARVLEAARGAAPHHRYVLQATAMSALGAQRWTEGVDALMQLSDLFSDAEAHRVLGVLMASSQGDDAVLKALQDAAARDTRWLEKAVRTLPAQQLPVSATMRLLGSLAADGAMTPELGRFVVRELKKEGQWLEAHAVWLSLFKRPLGLLFNGDFERALIADGFDWESGERDSPQAGVRLTQPGMGTRGQVLRVQFTGKPMRPPVVRQHLILPPGRYRLNGDYRADNLRTEGGMSWVVRCAGNPQQELARSAPLMATSRAWRPFGFDVDVPAGACLGVELALAPHAAVEARTGLRGEMLLDRLELVRR